MSDLRDQIAEAVKAWALAYPIPSWQLAHGEGAEKLATAWGDTAARHVMAVVQPAFDAKDAEIERLTEERDAARMVSQGRTMEQYDQEDLKRRTERAEADREWWSQALTRAIAERDRYRLAWESARRGRRSARILARELQWAIKQHSRAREKAEEKVQADLEAYTTDVLSVLAKKNAALEQAVAEREQLRATALDLVAKKDAEIERLWGQIHTGQQQARKVHAALGHDHLGENLSCAMCAALDPPPPEVTG